MHTEFYTFYASTWIIIEQNRETVSFSNFYFTDIAQQTEVLISDRSSRKDYRSPDIKPVEPCQDISVGTVARLVGRAVYYY